LNEELVNFRVELNQINYTIEDCEFLKNDGISKKYYTDISLNKDHWPSVVGWSAVMIIIIVFSVAQKVTEGLLSEFSSDLYKWSKNKLRNVTSEKEDFDETKVNIKFNNCQINIYCHNKDSLYYALENIDEILEERVKDIVNDENEINIVLNEMSKK